MIIIRRSKINSLIKLRELKNLRQLHPEMNKSAGWLLEHSDNLINVRNIKTVISQAKRIRFPF